MIDWKQQPCIHGPMQKSECSVCIQLELIDTLKALLQKVDKACGILNPPRGNQR